MTKNPIILLGGVSRSGKTYVRKNLFKEVGIEGFSLDILQAVIQKKSTGQADTFEGNYKDVVTHYSAYVESLINYQAKYAFGPYCIEGDILTPEFVSELDDSLSIIPVFLGYPSLNLEFKITQERLYSNHTSWTHKFDDRDLQEHLIGGREKSVELRKACRKYNFPFFDTSKELKKVVKVATTHIVKQLGEKTNKLRNS